MNVRCWTLFTMLGAAGSLCCTAGRAGPSSNGQTGGNAEQSNEAPFDNPGQTSSSDGADASDLPDIPEVTDTADPATIIRGTISGTLTAAGSPYRIVGDEGYVVTLPKGSTLTVEPGVLLDFAGDPAVTTADIDQANPNSVMNHMAGRVEFRVFGRIVVQGEKDNPVVMTSSNPYGWWGVNFYGTQSVGDGHPIFRYMVFEKVRKNKHNSARDWTRGALWAHYSGGPVTISNCVFRNNVASNKCAAIDLMFTDGSVVENSLFENNRVYEVDQFGTAGSFSFAGGGAVCVTHGRNTVLRGNTFRNNALETFRLQQYNEAHPGELIARPIMEWPNPQGRFDLGGGGAIHYFQPNNDLLENNLFEHNRVAHGPAAAVYVEDLGTRALTVRNNGFQGNTAASGAVLVCNRGHDTAQIVLTPDNQFTDNTVNGAPASRLSGDCHSVSQ